MKNNSDVKDARVAEIFTSSSDVVETAMQSTPLHTTVPLPSITSSS